VPRRHATGIADTTKLDYTARAALAKKWAIMPGGTAINSAVSNACASKLAGDLSQPTKSPRQSWQGLQP